MKNLQWIFFIVVGLCLIGGCLSKRNPRIIEPLNPHDPEALPSGKNGSVLIVGANPSGLSAALELASRGFKVHIVESGSWTGGDYAVMQANTTGPLNGLYLPRLQEAIYNNGYQTMDLLTRTGLAWYLYSSEYAYFIPLKKTLQKVGISEWSWLFYQELRLNFLMHCLSYSDLNSNVQKLLAGLDEATIQKLYANYTLKDLGRVLSVSENFYDCYLKSFASGSGLEDGQISAVAALTRMLYYVTSDSYALKNLQLTVNVRNSSYNLMKRMVDQLQKYNVTIETGYKLTRLYVDGARGIVLGDFDRRVKFDYVLLAGDVSSTLQILNNTKHLNDGAPKIFIPLSTALKHMDGLKNATSTKVATLWLNKPVKDTVPSNIVFAGYPNVERVSILSHLKPRRRYKGRRADSSTLLQVVLKNCDEVNCSTASVWRAISSQVTTAIPDLQNSVATDVVITDRLGSVSAQLHEERHRERVDYLQRLGISNLVLGGNWLETQDYPADGLERDLSLGREAANAILLKAGVRQVRLVVAHNQGESVSFRKL